MARKQFNIVDEIVSSTIHGRPGRVGPSPLCRTSCCRLQQHLLSFQCLAHNEYDFVDTLDPTPTAPVHRPPIYSCSFGKDEQTGHLLAIGGEDGHIAIIDTTVRVADTTIPPSSVLNVHQNAVMDVSWVPGSEELVSGGGDKTAVVWQLRAGRLHPLLKLLGHTRSVKTVAVNPYDPVVFATGSRDSNIIVWDRRCSPNNRADEIVPAHPGQTATSSVASPRYRRRGTSSAGSEQAGPSGAAGGGTMALHNGVTSLLFSNQHTLLSSGASDGLIKVWDLRKSHCLVRSAPLPQHTLQQPHTSCKLGFSCLTAPQRSQYVYALAMDNNIYAYHLAGPTPSPVACYSGSLNLSYYVKAAASPCGRYLVAGSTDNRALLWLTERPGMPAAQFGGYHGEVTAVDWGQCGEDKVATCSDDFKQKVFFVRRSDPDDLDENLQIKGSAEPVDQEVLDRCQRSLSNLYKCKVSAQDDRYLQGSVPPMPKTPSSSRSSAALTNLLQTPLRQNTSSSAINNTPRGAAGVGISTTPMYQMNTCPTDSFITTPMQASSSDHHLLQAISNGNHGLVRRTLLSSPRQGRDPAPSPLPVSSAGRLPTGVGTPQTPSSVDRSLTLLQWLSSAKKTPRGTSAATDATPRQPLLAGGCVSASKRAGIKRKLTEVMEETSEDLENVLVDGSCEERPNKKSPLSPTMNVLGIISNEDLINVPSSAAKMLKYERNEEKNDKEPSQLDPQLESVLGIGDSVQPFEPSMLDTLRNSSFRSSFGESKNPSDDRPNLAAQDNDSNNLIEYKTHELTRILPTILEEEPHTVDDFFKSRFESPTANLPNFVADGTSPRVRPVPVFRDKPPTNWLSSIAQQKKLRTVDCTPDKPVAPKTTSAKKKKRNVCGKVSASKAMKKKYLKIIALSDSPMGEPCKRTPKGTQTKLNFRL